MRFTKTVVTGGLAMFSMFFGSANLVFPVSLGTETLSSSYFAAIGLFLTGVIVPFIGLMSIILYAGDRQRFFAYTGKVPGFLLAFTMLSLLGPFAVVPRCIVVAYGGVQLFMPSLGLLPFAIGFCLLTLLVIWKHDKIIPILGRVLTPLLILGVGIVIAMGMIKGGAPIESDLSGVQAFKIGLFEGYQTMDLLAAFFFAATVVGYVNVHLTATESPRLLIRLSSYSSIIAISLLGLVYFFFVLLGAKYAPLLQGVAPEQLLATIAGHTMGKIAIPVVSITIALACLTTATILTILFAEFLSSDIMRGRLNRHPAILITLAIALLVSLQGFGAIKLFLASVLTFVYPAVIALAAGGIIRKLSNIKFNLGGWAFWSVLALMAILRFL
ncbi:MAG: branched-chain amino acid transporter [Verrucomicrobia bacterium CG_4_10_14_3_um_filter_43_23]|nr:MAG: branched-chain amino acid transporter [Verrucomicrobia bacterium CG22_combo_CG10-13_8_21_14_all_43_17]PIX57644.1 MAG: branched-chain amino acid transporter [Verrucomicrobia bacterium CG_4_10_14_3_um_filter_43_23]PIY61779.1 MAG: branched-chain amino acid transporter [Verrucomicrobia bacterium CG_4_10_14_0_8_um_filter_43_34]PJA44728.1 MAG: branched-chain amino acid transporter [Verrucomicrobia bacterium CG_4_9_14_3_um_filter_43_20]